MMKIRISLIAFRILEINHLFRHSSVYKVPEEHIKQMSLVYCYLYLTIW